MKSYHCPRCNQDIHYYAEDVPRTIDCPRCGLTLIVREQEEDCPVCHGKGATIDHHDPCSECDGVGKIRTL